jgi:hypothetical protein
MSLGMANDTKIIDKTVVQLAEAGTSAPLTAWVASTSCSGVNGKVYVLGGEISGGRATLSRVRSGDGL